MSDNPNAREVFINHSGKRVPMRSMFRSLTIVCFICAAMICVTACGSTGSGKKFEPPASSYEQKFFAFSDGSLELRVKGASVTQNFFEGSPEQPLLGRLFTKDEFNRQSRRVALISKGFWVRHLKSDPAIIGKPISVNGVDFTVVGIVSDSFNVPSGAELWIPKL
jgi:hypothetical protein